MHVVAVIPARMASTRLPGKPLAALLGKPMIEHIYHRTAMCEEVDEVIVATCDEEIRIVAEGFGAPVAMTSDRHERASERMAEVAESTAGDVFVLVQGDEPMLHPDMISAALAPFQRGEDVSCVNLMRRIDDEADFLSPNTIKATIDANSDALYMSRQPIPTMPKGWGSAQAFKQVCVIPFAADELAAYARLEETPLERAESVDMMRLIEHGRKVRMVETPFDTHAVDTEEDRVMVEKLLADDEVLERYT